MTHLSNAIACDFPRCPNAVRKNVHGNHWDLALVEGWRSNRAADPAAHRHFCPNHPDHARPPIVVRYGSEFVLAAMRSGATLEQAAETAVAIVEQDRPPMLVTERGRSHVGWPVTHGVLRAAAALRTSTAAR